MIRSFKELYPNNPRAQHCDHAYRDIFQKIGLKFSSLRSDTCKKCDELYVKEIGTVNMAELDSIYEESRAHHEKAEEAYKKMHDDKLLPL